MTTTRKQITAKFTGKCERCGRLIPSGTTCTWAQGEGIRHINCTATDVAKHVDAQHTPVVKSEDNKQPSVTMGVFKKDDRIYVVKPNREKTRVYAKEIVESPARMTENGAVVDFETRYAPGIVFKLTEADRWALADAKDFLTKFSRCIVCGRHLKAAKSVERSIGPVCAGYFRGSSHVNGCAHHDSAAPKGAVAAAASDDQLEADEARAYSDTQASAANVEGTCSKCHETFSNCTSDYHCARNQKMNALRAAPLTDDEKALIAHIDEQTRKTEAWVAEDPQNRWATTCVNDIAHWREYGISSVADFKAMEAAEAEKEARKESYYLDDVVQPTLEESNAQLLARDDMKPIKAIDAAFRLALIKARNARN
jgi:hypothetical protein